MTPKEYLDRYTNLRFFSPFNLMQVQAGISNYGSGWSGTSRYGSCQPGNVIQQECQRFIRALRVVHHGNVNTPCGEKFFFNQKPVLAAITPLEDFYSITFTNCFVGKGSPDEIIDTLRLAMLVGRFGSEPDAAGQPPAAPNAPAYATKFVTLDCNGLVGNYYGRNGNAAIESYASAGRKRTRIGDVQVGDVVVTHCAKFPFEHVGLIQEWSPQGSNAAIKVVEWGWFGGEDVHCSRTAFTQPIVQGPDRRYGIGWSTTSPKDKTGKTPTFRYVFAPPTEAGEPNGWG